MRYMGGKMRIGKAIAGVIQTYAPKHYHEPFCGMFSVGKHIRAYRTASDLHPDLILMLKAIRDGWEPPTSITEEQYDQLATEKPSALRGFVGFGCSFYGKFFGGFGRDPKMRDFATLAKENMERLRPLIQGVEFTCEPYWEYPGDADTLYCDPPYQGATDYSVGKFDSSEFWEWVRLQSKRRKVFVSEYVAPEDFEAIWSRPYTTTVKDKTGKGIRTMEKLFKLK